MAPKKGSKNGSDGFGGYTFIAHNLTADDKRWLEACDVTIEFPLERIVDLVSVGYKVSFSPDFANHSIICSATDKQENSPHFKRILSGRGSTTFDAWVSLAYRHFHLAEEDWSYFGTSSSENDGKYG